MVIDRLPLQLDDHLIPGDYEFGLQRRTFWSILSRRSGCERRFALTPNTHFICHLPVLGRSIALDYCALGHLLIGALA